VTGIYRRSITLASGKFAVIQRDDHFTIVQWRDILERFRGREVARGGSPDKTRSPAVSGGPRVSQAG
jgi:hypothetical protein